MSADPALAYIAQVREVDAPCKICGAPSMDNCANLALCLDHAEQLVESWP